MATAADIETLFGELARETPKRDRAAASSGLTQLGNAVVNLKANKALVDDIVSDADGASQNDYQLEQIQGGWTGLFQAAFTAWSYNNGGGAKTGISGLAQLIADFQEAAGLEGGANELRLYKNGVVVAVDQDA